MLSADGIVTGAGASWDFSKKYGPAEVSLGAYLDTGGEISFKPIQVGAFISLGGYAYVGLFKFKLGFTVSATLAAEAPRPFIVTGSFTLVVDIPKPFKDLEIGVDLSWTFESARNTDEIEFLDTSDVENRAPVQALNFVTGESFVVRYLGSAASVPAPDDWADYVIPIDSYVDIEFSKYVKPDASGVTMGRYGGVVGSPSYTELIPPRKGKSTQVKHEFHVRNVFIKFWDGTWKDYDIYTAMTPLEDLDDVSAADLADSSLRLLATRRRHRPLQQAAPALTHAALLRHVGLGAAHDREFRDHRRRPHLPGGRDRGDLRRLRRRCRFAPNTRPRRPGTMMASSSRSTRGRHRSRGC